MRSTTTGICWKSRSGIRSPNPVCSFCHVASPTCPEAIELLPAMANATTTQQVQPARWFAAVFPTVA
jgi:hypothetical protein